MSTLGITPLIQNQLQFNLDVPPSLANYASQPRRPGPIVVEKLWVPSTSPKHFQNPLRFSTISEEDMEIAVHQARRDLKRKRMEFEVEQYVQRMAERVTPKINKKEDERRKARERLGIGSQMGRTTKKTLIKHPSRGRTSQSRTNPLRTAADMRPHSPPTRDTDYYHPKLTQDERTALEIRRLRRDLRDYIDEINRLDVVIRRPEPTNLIEDITDEEYYARQRSRVLGRATRSSRLVYDLKQQVRAIYNDITCMRPEEEPRKKSEVIKRLAAVHRATIRALQDLIHQLPEAGHDDVGKISRDLGALIEQLTDCCQQMEIADPREDKDVENLISKNPVAASVWKEVAQGPIEFSQKLCRPYQPEVPIVRQRDIAERSSSDERTKALCAGLENLLRARSPPKQVTRPAVTVTFEDEPETRKNQSSAKGVLIIRPKKKVKKGKNVEKLQKKMVVIEQSDKPHYTEETIAHRIKMRGPVERQANRSRSRSPRAPSPKIVSMDKIEKLNLGIPNEWVDQAESAIRHRLQPLLLQAKRLSAAQQSPSSMRQLLSVKALDRIECNAGLLVDLILEDLLKDTACEIVNLETEERIEHDANLLIHGSELHTMMDRLELIEREQMEIRERWNSVRYNGIVEVPSLPLSEMPRTPEPTTVQAGPVDLHKGIVSHPPRAALDKSPIIFTNEPTSARLRSEKLDMLRTQALKNEMRLVQIPHTAPILTEDEVDAIHQYRKLKLINLHKREKYVRMAEKVVNEIMEDLLESAAEEMMRTSSELDDQICMQELAVGKNVNLSTTYDTENVVDENATIDERFPVNFEDDSVMDLHDMIHDDFKEHSYLDEGQEDGEVARIVADAQQRGLHQSPSKSHQSRPGHVLHREDQEEVSYHDDRELYQFEDVGHLETVVREIGEHKEESEDEEEEVEESEEEEEESKEERRAALLSQDINDLQPIRMSQETEEIEETDVCGEYSSEFVSTTAEDSTGQDSAR